MQLKYFFHQQSLFKMQLVPAYYLELAAAPFLKLKDSNGDTLTLYESDFRKLHTYLEKKHIKNFTDLTDKEKLMHLADSKVRITRYFSLENLAQYELNVPASLENNMSDLISQNGMKMPKNGQKICVVLYQNRIYIHPKIRSVPGTIEPEAKQGVIGVSHSSLSRGHQVTFSGVFEYDEKHGWVIHNESGHYIPRVHQIKIFLIALQKRGMDLSKFTLKLWVPNKPGEIIPINETNYHLMQENAAGYLKRMHDSQSRYQPRIV